MKDVINIYLQMSDEKKYSSCFFFMKGAKEEASEKTRDKPSAQKVAWTLLQAAGDEQSYTCPVYHVTVLVIPEV